MDNMIKYHTEFRKLVLKLCKNMNEYLVYQYFFLKNNTYE